MNSFDRLNASMNRAQEINERKNNPAEYMADRLLTLIKRQEQSLGEDKELGILVVGAGNAFHLRSIRASNPDMLIFTGLDAEGNGVQLIQHHTQAAVMLVALPKFEEKPFRVGFTAE
ncbi:hypothetical protein F9K94_17400 [Brucella tritici]|uniref:Uncharacterized protein n=1 Tax=Brucella tritici TaxID=94626 RepID=A0A7V8B1R2_9HYPH|nr:hypothetical protein [Brucella tritici]KAB2656275.1 hypothetical protein F9K94_17400 [Brucella tritici]